MRSFIISSDALTATSKEQAQAPDLSALTGNHAVQSIMQAFNAAKQSIMNYSARIAYALLPAHHHPTLHIKHLHNSCRKLDNPSRRVFFLYVKGFSLNEISEMSGADRKTIMPTIHGIMNKIHHDTSAAS